MKAHSILLIICAAALVSASCGTARSQTVSLDRELASGHERPYDFDTPALTVPPDGYVPFYISHYGRHGSRYAWDPKTYSSIYNALQKGDSTASLTPAGEKLWSDYQSFCRVPMTDYGCLVPLGQEQHKRLAERMVSNFPQVFSRGIDSVSARASTSPRAIASMNAFTLSLQKAVPSLDIGTRVLTSDLAVTRSQAPADMKGPFYLRGENAATLPSKEDYICSRVDVDSIIDRFFASSTKVFSTSDEKAVFCLSLYDIWCGYHNYSPSDFLEGIFNPQEVAQLWEASNFSDYKATVENYHIDIYNLLTDIIAYGDRAIAGSGGVCADLRFGHDVIISMLLMELNIGTMGGIPSNADDVKNCFQNYNVPMASNLQFVLYRLMTKMNGPILFKLLVNECEAAIPSLEPVTGAYYDWNDFKVAFGTRPKAVE